MGGGSWRHSPLGELDRYSWLGRDLHLPPILAQADPIASTVPLPKDWTDRPHKT